MKIKPRWSRLVFWLIAVFVAVFVWGLNMPANAQEIRPGMGVGATNGNDYTSGELLLSDGRFYISAAVMDASDQPEVKRYTFGRTVKWRHGKKIQPYLRFGVAYWSEAPEPFISDHLTFDMNAGVRLFRYLELEIQHNSTGGRSERNKGSDLILLGLVFEL